MAFRFQLLRAGRFMLDGGAMFGIVPKPLWSRLVEPDERNRIPLNTNCLLLEGHGRRILIEAGIGEKLSPKERDIYALEDRSVLDALREVGCEPGAIDMVVVSHLHFDHAGGLTKLSRTGDLESPPVSAFPNARIVSQRREWEDALAGRSTMHKTYLRSHLDPVAGQMELVEGEQELVPGSGLRVFPIPGHTWGQQAVAFPDEESGRTVVFAADLLPTVHHAAPTHGMAYDMLPYENMLRKQALLREAHEKGWLLALDHEPGPALVEVEPHPQRRGVYTLRPAASA